MTHYTAENYLKKVRAHTEPYTHEILGKEIIIYPNVMSPKYDRAPQMIIAMMQNQNGKDVLEIGCGSGILSLFSFFQGANKVLAVDINPQAIENTRANFNKYSCSNCEVIFSNLFEKIEEEFDTIIFNAPFHGYLAKDELELGTYDYEYRTLTRFFKSVKNYLKPQGEILLGFADTGDNSLVLKLIKESNLAVKSLDKYPNGDWTMYLYTIIRNGKLG